MTSLGFDHEMDEEDHGFLGGDEEYGLSLWNAARLWRRPVYLGPDGMASFIPCEEHVRDAEVQATAIQAQVGGVLQTLGFESAPSHKVGGEQKYTLPRLAARNLRRHNFVVHPDGKIGFFVG